ncbi:hypothetical protein BCS89_09805 [Vibrio splendidus]|nr:hypothetical protein BCS97_13085 [Vibrio splendidus]PMP27611.1 hypothetical protein BCS89_09805 [Vibrio splendidus]PMP41199.1 hypothetical protein BCS88_03925 [Vibrio splendidus]PMP42407.1 hypothetical protein BCS85_22115 [Vibrio splendidus]PMP45404.1 hypothetical protein BCS87_04100 [Vibrio splendidus]
MGGLSLWDRRELKKSMAVIYWLRLYICYIEAGFGLSTVAFAQDPSINHSLLIVDLSGGDKIAPKI